MTQLILPLILLAVLIPPMLKRQRVYDIFIEGASEGLGFVKTVFMPLLAVTSAVYMLRAAGFFDLTAAVASRLLERAGLPNEVLPLALMRPFSGSGALGILSDILNTCGADSRAGFTASVIAGGSETTFYALGVYSAASKKRFPKRVIAAAVCADIAAVITGSVVCGIMQN